VVAKPVDGRQWISTSDESLQQHPSGALMIPNDLVDAPFLSNRQPAEPPVASIGSRIKQTETVGATGSLL
jgi:hypothetical protein